MSCLQKRSSDHRRAFQHDLGHGPDESLTAGGIRCKELEQGHYLSHHGVGITPDIETSQSEVCEQRLPQD